MTYPYNYFKVVPQELRDATNTLKELGNRYEDTKTKVEAQKMDAATLGLLGKWAGLPQAHNEAVDQYLKEMKEGVARMENAAQAMDFVADRYEAKDAEYYKKFGYILDK